MEVFLVSTRAFQVSRNIEGFRQFFWWTSDLLTYLSIICNILAAWSCPHVQLVISARFEVSGIVELRGSILHDPNSEVGHGVQVKHSDHFVEWFLSANEASSSACWAHLSSDFFSTTLFFFCLTSFRLMLRCEAVIFVWLVGVFSNFFKLDILLKDLNQNV